MRKIRNALLGILTMMSGAILAVPTEAAERYIPGVHHYKERFFSFPYGGSYLKRAKRAFGNPYVNPYYGSYYASPVLLRLLELPLSLLLVILRHGSCSYGLRSGRLPDWLKMKNPHSPSASRNRHVCHGETRAD